MEYYHCTLLCPAHCVSHFEFDSRILMQNIVQRTTFGELHHEKDMRSFGTGTEQLHDIRMSDAR